MMTMLWMAIMPRYLFKDDKCLQSVFSVEMEFERQLCNNSPKAFPVASTHVFFKVTMF